RFPRMPVPIARLNMVVWPYLASGVLARPRALRRPFGRCCRAVSGDGRRLADDHPGGRYIAMRRHDEVGRRGALNDAPRIVEPRAMTRTDEPARPPVPHRRASVLRILVLRHAAEVRAHALDDQVFGIHGAVRTLDVV